MKASDTIEMIPEAIKKIRKGFNNIEVEKKRDGK